LIKKKMESYIFLVTCNYGTGTSDWTMLIPLQQFASDCIGTAGFWRCNSPWLITSFYWNDYNYKIRKNKKKSFFARDKQYEHLLSSEQNIYSKIILSKLEKGVSCATKNQTWCLMLCPFLRWWIFAINIKRHLGRTCQASLPSRGGATSI